MFSLNDGKPFGSGHLIIIGIPSEDKKKDIAISLACGKCTPLSLPVSNTKNILVLLFFCGTAND